MRFFFAFVSLLLLTQPAENSAINEPPGNSTFSTKEYENLPVKDLESELQIAQSQAKSAKDKFDEASKILEKNVTEAKRLDAVYEENKKMWERLSAADEELTKATVELAKITSLLVEARQNETDIGERPKQLQAAQEEMQKLVLTKTTKSCADLETEKTTAWTKYKAMDNTWKQLDKKIADDKCKDPDTANHAPTCDETLQKFKPYDKKHNDFATAEVELAKCQNYETEYPKLDNTVKELTKAVAAMQQDSKIAKESVTQLEGKETLLKQQERDANDAIAREPKTFEEVSLDLATSEEEKDQAEKEVAKQKEVVQGLQKISNEANNKAEALKNIHDNKKEAVREEPKSAGSKAWIIAVVIVLILIIVVIVCFVLWKRRQKKRKESPVTAAPPSDSKTKASGSKSGSKSQKGSTKSNEIQSKSNVEKPKDIGVEVNTANPPADMPKLVVDKIAEHAKPGTTTVRRFTLPDGKKETHYDCTCNQKCRIDDNGNRRCLHDGKQVKIKGPVTLQEEYSPENCGVNVWEGKKEDRKIDKIEYDMEKIEGYLVGTGVDNVIKKTGESKDNSAAMEHFSKENIPTYLSEVTKYQYLGTTQYPYKFDWLMELIAVSLEHFKKGGQLENISQPVTIIGDLHGEYNTVNRIFSTNSDGDKPGWNQTKYVCLGDYVDRGFQQVETIVLLLMLRIQSPQSFILLRGNHEDWRTNKLYGFHKHLTDRYGEKQGQRLFKAFNEVFSYMPHACIISDAVMCMHGGISPELESRAMIEALKKPVDPIRTPLSLNMLWSDFVTGVTGFVKNLFRQGNGTCFGEPAVLKTLKALGIKLIIRAHSMIVNGAAHACGHSFLTLFSCVGKPEHGVPHENLVAVTAIEEDGRISRKYFIPGIVKDGVLNVEETEAVFIERFDKTNDRNWDYHNKKELEKIGAGLAKAGDHNRETASNTPSVGGNVEPEDITGGGMPLV